MPQWKLPYLYVLNPNIPEQHLGVNTYIKLGVFQQGPCSLGPSSLISKQRGRQGPTNIASVFCGGPVGATAVTATATSDRSLICNLHHSSQQHRILNPLARPGIEPTTSWFPVGFISAAPQLELLLCLFFNACYVLELNRII